VILSSEFRLGSDSNPWGRVHPLLASGLVHFTGLHQAQNEHILVGQLIYTGVATFATGRKQRVYYYANVMVTSSDVPRDFLLAPALAEVESTIAWAANGYLYKWLWKRAFRWIGSRPKYRKITAIRWDRWCDPYLGDQDRLEHVCR